MKVKMDNQHELMSLKEAASFLGRTEESLLSLYEEGALDGVRFGDTYCFRTEDLRKTRDMVAKKRQAAIPPEQALIINSLPPENIIFRTQSDKKSILLDMIEVLSKLPESGDRGLLERGIFAREELMSTGMGLGIAIPHVRLPSIRDTAMAAALVRDGVADYEALDGLPVRILFMIIARENQHAEHLKIVSQLSLRLKEKNIRDALLKVEDGEEFLEIITSPV